jgi:transposase
MSKKSVNGAYWQKPPAKRDQLVLIPVSLEEKIPDGHPVRMIDEILDTFDWSEWEKTYHRGIGQPPIHPSILCKVLLFAMIRRIRSSRSIEYEIEHSVDFMWLVSGRTIDHSTISDFRRSFKQQLKGIHQQMIRYAIKLGVAKLSELCVDGTRVRANASRHKTWTAERLEKLLKELDEQIEKAMAELETNDSVDELFDDGTRADKLPPELANIKDRRAKLAELLEQTQEMDRRRKADGIDPKKNPAQLPKSDTDARILPNKEGGYAPNYTPLTVNEMTNGFIIDADVLIGNVEHLHVLTTVDTIGDTYGFDIRTLMADSAFATGPNIAALENRGIEFLSPLSEVECENNPARRDDPSAPVAADEVARLPVNLQSKTFDRKAFVYDAEVDKFYCPAGKTLSRESQETRQTASGPVLKIVYFGDDCEGCELAPQCRKNPHGEKGRKLTRDEHEEVRARHSQRMSEPKTFERYKQRQHFGEMPFAVMKACFDMRRFLLRGHEGVRAEWQWCCTAFNLKKLVTLMAALRAKQEKMVAVET